MFCCRITVLSLLLLFGVVAYIIIIILILILILIIIVVFCMPTIFEYWNYVILELGDLGAELFTVTFLHVVIYLGFLVGLVGTCRSLSRVICIIIIMVRV